MANETTARTLDRNKLASLLAGSNWANLIFLEKTGSTNQDLLIQAAKGAPSGTVLVANQQTNGRGRLGRSWQTEPGDSVAFSCLLAPEQDLTTWTWLPPAAGIAVRQAILKTTSITQNRVSLKWPNDVLVDEKKICGTLTEQTTACHRRKVVIGIGVNTFMSHERLPVPNATSLKLAGCSVDPNVLVAEILSCLDELIQIWTKTGSLREIYLSQLATINKPVKVVLSETNQLQGLALTVDEHGSLVVDVAGEEKTFAAADVFHLR